MSVRANINPRRLTERIYFEKKQKSRDMQTGAESFTWATATGEMFACVDATRANEVFLADQKLPARDYTIWIYWRDDIESNMRVRWRGRILEIVGIPDNQKRGLFMSVFCIEGRSKA